LKPKEKDQGEIAIITGTPSNATATVQTDPPIITPAPVAKEAAKEEVKEAAAPTTSASTTTAETTVNAADLAKAN